MGAHGRFIKKCGLVPELPLTGGLAFTFRLAPNSIRQAALSMPGDGSLSIRERGRHAYGPSDHPGASTGGRVADLSLQQSMAILSERHVNADLSNPADCSAGQVSLSRCGGKPMR